MDTYNIIYTIISYSGNHNPHNKSNACQMRIQGLIFISILVTLLKVISIYLLFYTYIFISKLVTLLKVNNSSPKIVFIKLLVANLVLFFLFVSAGKPNSSTITYV